MSFPSMIARNYSRRSSVESTTFAVLIIGGLLGLLLIADISSADMLPSEESYPITLPDGSTHNLFLEGTSEYNYEVDENGYTVVECIDPSLDQMSRCYGKLNNSTGYVESTGFLLGSMLLAITSTLLSGIALDRRGHGLVLLPTSRVSPSHIVSFSPFLFSSVGVPLHLFTFLISTFAQLYYHTHPGHFLGMPDRYDFNGGGKGESFLRCDVYNIYIFVCVFHYLQPTFS